MATRAGVLVLALDEPAREAGLNASALGRQFLGGRGGGTPETGQGGGIPADRISGVPSDLPALLHTAG
ncbi:hypothetical protein [Streptomyces niger]|uniref:hypothetical protein n=1 Tax=Streptomyces niger TaxID=66373 RepID=UPI00069B4269|nr:hypothetical protein [Streptomyces niger]